MFFFSPCFFSVFFHVGCTNNRWLWRRPVEGRLIQIQGHSLPLFHQKNCKCECKLLPSRTYSALTPILPISLTFFVCQRLLAQFSPDRISLCTLHFDQWMSHLKRPALAVQFWTFTYKEFAYIFQMNNTLMRYFLCFTSSWGYYLCLFMK